MTAAWRPADEREAASDFGLYLEWLRATGHLPDAGPETLPREAFGEWLDIYVSDGDPVRGATIRAEILRRAPPDRHAPRSRPPSPA